MKRFSRRNFSQIMINNSLKNKLYQLKKIIKLETKSKFDLSYNDVVDSLVKNYYKPKRYVYPIEQKILAVIPLKPVTTLSVSLKPVTTLVFHQSLKTKQKLHFC